MASVTTRLRPARPEFNEGLLFARYMDQAAEGFFRFMFGRDSERIMATAFVEPAHSLSHEYVVFAEQDGVVVGMSSAFSGTQHSGFTEEPLARAVGRAAFRVWCVRVALRPVWRILETVPEKDFYLQGLAVEPSLRGAGIGSVLMRDVEERAKASGSARLCLHVSAKNDGARRLYARRGMVESSQWPASRLLPSVFIRMCATL